MGQEEFQEAETSEFMLKHVASDLVSNLLIFPQQTGPDSDAPAMSWEQKKKLARVIELSRPKGMGFEEPTPTDWAALQEQHNLEKENQRLRKQQAERRDWLKNQLIGLPDQWRAFRKAELLEGLHDTNPHLDYADYEALEQKKGMIFAQNGLPVEYLQADTLSKHLQAVNQILIELKLDEQAGLPCPEGSADKLVELKALKDKLYADLAQMETALKQRFPLAWLINGLRWILEKLS